MSFEQQIRDAERVALFLDFDGTLAPIVPRPADAAMPDATRAALECLATQLKYKIAFVSGRSVADLEEKAAIPGCYYAGNHGLEIQGTGLEFSMEEDPVLRRTVERLRRAVAAIPDVEIEDKGLSASVHFRRVPASEWPHVQEAVRSTVPPELNLRGGKMVFEIRPRTDWNKGSAVRWLIEQLHLEGACHVYIGDDLTDEDAFAVMPDGVTVHVGNHVDTIAKHRLKDTEDVRQILERLAHGS